MEQLYLISSGKSEIDPERVNPILANLRALGFDVISLSKNNIEMLYKVVSKNLKAHMIFKTDEDVLNLKFIICKELGIDNVDDIDSKKRSDTIPMARHIFSALLYKDGHGTSEQIGAMSGGRDHASVLHSVKVVQNIIDTKDYRYFHSLRTICLVSGMLKKMKIE